MMIFRYTLMEMPGHDIEVEADYFEILDGGTLAFYKAPESPEAPPRIIRAVNARVWRVVE